MKIRSGFVSNSSSCSFLITNKTDEVLPMSKLAEEAIVLFENFLKEYDWYVDNDNFTREKFIMSANKYQDLQPGSQEVILGDEDGTVFGHVCDYMMRDGGSTTSFSWNLLEFLR